MEKVKKLRAATGAGMLDCQKALRESGDDIDAAIEFLRKKGLAKAAKKSDRTASEGLISVSLTSEGNKYGLVELNCETDFVARNPDFHSAAKELAEHARDTSFSSLEDFLAKSFHKSSVEDHLKLLISKFGENTVIGKAVSEETKGFFESYIHSNGKLAVIVEAEGEYNSENRGKARDVAMHIAAMSPQFLDESSVDSLALEKEKEIYRAELAGSGKPEQVIDRIVEGKIGKYYQEVCLVKQKFVKDPNLTVADYVGNLKLLSFKRVVLGENWE